MSGAPSPLREIYGAASGSAAHGRLWEYPPSMHPRSGGQAPWSMIPRQPKWEEKTARRSPYSSPERHREVPKEEEVDDEPPSPREDMAKILAEAAKAAAEAAKAAEQAKVAAEEEYKRQKAAAVRLAVEPASPKADPEAPKPVRKHVPKRIGPVDVPSRYWAAHIAISYYRSFGLLIEYRRARVRPSDHTARSRCTPKTDFPKPIAQNQL